jgi:hypothetical protein
MPLIGIRPSDPQERGVLGRAVARLGESAVVFLQLFAAGANIEVAFGVLDEVAARKSSVRSLGLVHQFHVRLDPTLVHQPPDHLGRAVSCVGDQGRRDDKANVTMPSSAVLVASDRPPAIRVC